MRKLIAIVVTAFLLTAAACSDDDDRGAVSTDNEYVQSMLAVIEDDDSFPLSLDEAECLVSRWIGAIGVDTLEDAGITPEDVGREELVLTDLDLDLTEDQARLIADSFGRCDIALGDLVVDNLPPAATDEIRTCVEDNIDEDAIADQYVRDVLGETGEDEDLVWMLELATACPGLLGVITDE